MANVSDATARKAAEAGAAYEARFAGLELRLERMDGRLGRLTTSIQILAAAAVGILLSQFGLWNEIGKLDGHLAQIGSQVSHIEQIVSRH
jgi:hypothetical protein